MRLILLRSALALVAVAIAWLCAARPLSLLVDRCYTAPLSAMPVRPLAYSMDTLWIADFPLALSPAVGPLDVRIDCDAADRVTLSAAGRRFALGRCVTRLPPGTGEFQFVADPGDHLSLEVRHGVISWPTPFDFNFMTGKSPSWRRNLYYRLLWKKPSGAQLAIVWRFEQPFYPIDRWTSGTAVRAGSTGLLSLAISGAAPAPL